MTTPTRAARGADLALTFLAALGVVCLLAALAGPVLGLRLLVFRSDSMAPSITTGSVALVHRIPVDEVHEGDVVAVHTVEGTRVTHRVVQRTGDQLVLRGDANDADDPVPYTPVSVDRVVAHAAGLGYVVAAATSPGGVLVLLSVVLVLTGLLLRRRQPEATTPRHARVRSGVAACVVLASVPGFAVLGPGQVRPGWAAPWTDPVPMTNAPVLTATTLGTTTVSCGLLSLLSTPMTWTAVPGATGYRVHYGPNGTATQDYPASTTGVTATQPISGTLWVEVLVNYGSTTWVSPISNKVNYTVLLGLIGSCGPAT